MESGLVLLQACFCALFYGCCGFFAVDLRAIAAYIILDSLPLVEIFIRIGSEQLENVLAFCFLRDKWVLPQKNALIIEVTKLLEADFAADFQLNNFLEDGCGRF